MRLPFSFLSPGSDSSVCVLLALFLELPSHFRLFSSVLTPCCDWQCPSNLPVTAIESSLCCPDCTYYTGEALWFSLSLTSIVRETKPNHEVALSCLYKPVTCFGPHHVLLSGPVSFWPHLLLPPRLIRGAPIIALVFWTSIDSQALYMKSSSLLISSFAKLMTTFSRSC